MAMTEKPNPIDAHVGKRLRLRRSLVGMSQERLGELLGLTFQQIQKYERGANRIGSGRLYEIGRILGVPVSWFFEEMPARPLEPAPAEARLGGLAEEGGGFVFDSETAPAEPPPMEEPPLVDRRETLEMVRAFNRIEDALVRRRLFELAKALSEQRYKDAAPHQNPP